jgi:hypothetical protein
MSWLIQTLRHYPGIAIFLNTAKNNVPELGYTITYAVGNPCSYLGSGDRFCEMSAYRSLRKKEKTTAQKKVYELASSNAATPCSSSGVWSLNLMMKSKKL